MTLWEAFSRIKDFRHPGSCRYGLASLLMVCVMSAVSGSMSLRGCAQFCTRHAQALKQRFGWHSTPSFSTLSRVLRHSDRAATQGAFNRWMGAAGAQGEPVCADGKALRGTVSNPHDLLQHYAHTVQLYGQRSGLALAAADGKDEVAALLSLLAQMPPCSPAHTFTADALYTRKPVAAALRAAGQHYLLRVKANQPRLLERMRAHAAGKPPATQYTQEERNRGRHEARSLALWSAPAHETGWDGLATFLCLRRRRGGCEETVFYISSLPPDTPPETFAAIIRGHWHIENKFHWVKDVVMGEDKSRIRAGNAPYNAAVLRNVAFNLLSRRNKGITHAIREIAHDITQIFQLTTQRMKLC